jgi:hypothetical protein
MAYLMVRCKVKDFAKWKSLFDQHGETRKHSGSKGGYFFQNADNPNETIFLLEWENLADARKFAGDPSVQNVLMQAGLTDQPNVYFLEAAGRPKH